jgi:2',3'-cyclic-nucleotide 2'-phosphodiesterase (5'-nucleotidase family)
MEADDTTGIKAIPYQVFDVEGLKLGVIGAVQINSNGTPDAHPDVLRGLKFSSPFEAVSRYQWLSRQCNATILLSHVGYREDILIAEQNPWLDAIIGGHSHRQLSEKEPLHNGVLITQNRNLLSTAVHVTFTVDSGRVVSKKADYILVRTFPHPNKVAEAMVQTFSGDPFFKRILTRAETPFQTREELGAMVCDALMSETGADVAIMNYKGIRIRKLPAGDITIHEALEIDPYGSTAVLLDMKGDELEHFIISYGQMNTYKFPHLGGLRADLTLDKKGSNDITNVKLMAADGSRFNRKKTYRVVTNSYVITTYKEELKSIPTVLNITTSDIIIRYLQQQGTVSYQGKSRLNYLSPEK